MYVKVVQVKNGNRTVVDIQKTIYTKMIDGKVAMPKGVTYEKASAAEIKAAGGETAPKAGKGKGK